MAGDAGVAVDTKITIFYFGYRSAGSTDEEHQTCLKLHGTWDSLPEDSREWKAAKLEYHVRELKKHGR